MPKKNERGDSLVSPGMICYAEKQVNSFWSSSLGQMVLFDTIIFCRTFKNYFGQFVWIEKKKRKVTIIVAFHFMKRRLKSIQWRTQEKSDGEQSDICDSEQLTSISQLQAGNRFTLAHKQVVFFFLKK